MTAQSLNALSKRHRGRMPWAGVKTYPLKRQDIIICLVNRASLHKEICLALWITRSTHAGEGCVRETLYPLPGWLKIEIKGIAQPDELLTSSGENIESGGKQRMKSGERGRIRRVENGSVKRENWRNALENNGGQKTRHPFEDLRRDGLLFQNGGGEGS